MLQTLYLSKNCIKSLDGISNFKQLRVLSLADNVIDDFEALDALKEPGLGLEAASFEGNPIARLPNYRAQVIARLQGLQMLDGRPVGAEERDQAALALRHQDVVIALMLSNACIVHKLVGFLCPGLLMQDELLS